MGAALGMPAFEPAARYAGPRAGMIFTTRDGRTGYYADAAAQSSRGRDDASSSSASSLGGRDAKRRREKRREKKERKREKKKRKKEKKRRKKEKKRKRSASSSSSSSSSGSDVVRSAVSGKRIRLRVDKSAEDRARDAGRREMLRYMNAVSER